MAGRHAKPYAGEWPDARGCDAAFAMAVELGYGAQTSWLLRRNIEALLVAYSEGMLS